MRIPHSLLLFGISEQVNGQEIIDIGAILFLLGDVPRQHHPKGSLVGHCFVTEHHDILRILSDIERIIGRTLIAGPELVSHHSVRKQCRVPR